MQLGEYTISEFLNQLAAKSPTPGGGAVAAVTAATAASLAQMVVHYSLGKPSLAAHAPLHEASLAALQSLGAKALASADADAAAYSGLNALWKLPKDDPKRTAGWADAVAAAIAAPREVLRLCNAILEVINSLCPTINRQLASDLGIAADLAETGARAAAWNVRVNAPLLASSAKRDALLADLNSQLSVMAAVRSAIGQACLPA